MSSVKNKIVLNIVLVFSIFALITAYFIQYILDHAPCNLCLVERIPYLASIILISLIFILHKYERLVSLIVGLFFVFGAIISFYHFGIEQGFFSETFICEGINLEQTLSKKQLLEQLKKNVISCKNVNFKILGLSLATINAIASCTLSFIMMKLFINYGKN
jgi:disulfide bond formation protein DsbB